MNPNSRRLSRLVSPLLITLAVVLTVSMVGVAATGVAYTGTFDATAAGEDGTLSAVVVEDSDDEFAVSLETTADGVAGITATMTFDPDVVEVTDIQGADFRDPAWNPDNESGQVLLTQAVAGQNAVDEPTFATLSFEPVVEHGTSEVAFNESVTVVNDGEGETLDVTMEGAELVVGDGDPSDDGSDPVPEVRTIAVVIGAMSLLGAGAIFYRRDDLRARFGSEAGDAASDAGDTASEEPADDSSSITSTRVYSSPGTSDSDDGDSQSRD